MMLSSVIDSLKDKCCPAWHLVCRHGYCDYCVYWQQINMYYLFIYPQHTISFTIFVYSIFSSSFTPRSAWFPPNTASLE